MKKNSKLLAFALVLAMMASILCIPGLAAESGDDPSARTNNYRQNQNTKTQRRKQNAGY